MSNAAEEAGVRHGDLGRIMLRRQSGLTCDRKVAGSIPRLLLAECRGVLEQDASPLLLPSSWLLPFMVALNRRFAKKDVNACVGMGRGHGSCRGFPLSFFNIKH